MKQKAVGYIRVSSNGQEKMHGPERQRFAIQRYAKKHDITVVQYFQDAFSGTSENRPEYNLMLLEILANSGVDTVIVERLDRLARTYAVQEMLLVHLVGKGISVISAVTEENVTDAIKDDPMKKAMIQMQGIFHELEKSLLVARMRKGKEASGKKRGRPVMYPPELKEYIRNLYQEGISYNKIAALLNSEGHLNNQGNPWSPQLVRQVAIKG
jgi:DNA invertase Pin-like site-specific DNA recombinase